MLSAYVRPDLDPNCLTLRVFLKDIFEKAAKQPSMQKGIQYLIAADCFIESVHELMKSTTILKCPLYIPHLVVFCFLSDPNISRRPEYENISTLYRCMGKKPYNNGLFYKASSLIIMVFFFNSFLASGHFCHLMVTFSNSLDPDQDRHNVSPDLDPKCLTL